MAVYELSRGAKNFYAEIRGSFPGRRQIAESICADSTGAASDCVFFTCDDAVVVASRRNGWKR